MDKSSATGAPSRQTQSSVGSKVIQKVGGKAARAAAIATGAGAVLGGLAEGVAKQVIKFLLKRPLLIFLWLLVFIPLIGFFFFFPVMLYTIFVWLTTESISKAAKEIARDTMKPV